MAKTQYDITKLPKWAQRHICELKTEIKLLEAVKRMHVILSDHDRQWFTLRGPCEYDKSGRDVINLWILSDSQPFNVCSLRKNDLLFVGRSKDADHQPK